MNIRFVVFMFFIFFYNAAQAQLSLNLYKSPNTTMKMIVVLEDGVPIDSIYKTHSTVEIIDFESSQGRDSLAYIDEFYLGKMRYYLYVRQGNQFHLNRYISLRGQVYYEDVGVMTETISSSKHKDYTKQFRLNGLTNIVEYDTLIKDSDSDFSVYDSTRVYLFEGPYSRHLKLKKKKDK